MAQIDIDKFVISLMRYFGNNKGIGTTLDRCLFSLGLKYVDTPTGGRLERVDQPTMFEKIMCGSVEQKADDKIEPKFKVGEWIINAQGTLRHIINVDKGGYQTDGGWLSHDTYEKTFHLWTIQDAKDGDVLICEGCEYLLFKSFSDTDGRIKLHCWYNGRTNNFHLSTGVKLSQEAFIRPATKEQRDLLFQKMKEYGYEWDAEKKELKKIEQKLAWSEEDEKRVDQICEDLKCGLINFNAGKNVKGLHFDEIIESNIDWLKNKFKTLKPQNRWKPSEAQLVVLNDIIIYGHLSNANERILKGLQEQLKKLKD